MQVQVLFLVLIDCSSQHSGACSQWSCRIGLIADGAEPSYAARVTGTLRNLGAAALAALGQRRPALAPGAADTVGRAFSAGERALLRSLFAEHIDYDAARVYERKWLPLQPPHTAMAPDGNIYFPRAHYRVDFSLATVPLTARAWFVHEGAHLYQFYGLKWNVIARGIVSRRYRYALVKGKPFARYGLEQMGAIAADYYMLTQRGTIGSAYTLEDFADLLPLG